MVSENNKRIAKNTMLLYVRTLFSQLLALYTSRKILEIIGVEDFGIYNVVGGVVVMLTFLNGSMGVATQRYLTIELGKNDMLAYNKIFSMACIIHIVMALLIFVAAETLGLWFLNAYLNIPSERMFAANCIYQASILVVLLGIVQTPYNASLMAHERMSVYAYVGMGESVLRLLIVFLLLVISYDRLITYAFLLLGVQLISALIYRIYCIHHFEECKFHWVWDKTLFRSMLGFTGWNLFGTIAWILKDQGNNMLMNIFGGPLINAARGVSYQVSSAVQNLVNGFGTAVNPQLTKSYASEDKKGLHQLMFSSSRISFFLLLLIALPVMIEIPYLLHLWLVEVPAYTVLFTRIILLEALFNTLSGTLITCLLATGIIKWYQIVVGSIMLLNIPISYLLLKLGFSIETPLIVSLVIILISTGVRLWFGKFQLSINILAYVREVVKPVMIVLVLSPIFPLFVYKTMECGFLRLIVIFIISVLSVALCVYFLGMSKGEQSFLHAFVRNHMGGCRK